MMSIKSHTCLNVPAFSIAVSVPSNMPKKHLQAEKPSSENETIKKPPQFLVTADPSCKGADGIHPYAITKWETTQHISYQESTRSSNKRESILSLKAILCSQKS